MRSIITRGTGPGKNAAPDAEDSPGNEGKTWFGSNQKVWVWPRTQVTCAEAMKRLIDMKSSDAQRYANFLTGMNGKFWDAGDYLDCEAGTKNTKPTWVIVNAATKASDLCGLEPAKNRAASGDSRLSRFKAAVGTEPTLSNAATFHAYYSALNNTAICTTRVVPEAERKEYKNINNGVGTDVSSQLSARIGSTTVSSYKSFYYDAARLSPPRREDGRRRRCPTSCSLRWAVGPSDGQHPHHIHSISTCNSQSFAYANFLLCSLQGPSGPGRRRRPRGPARRLEPP